MFARTLCSVDGAVSSSTRSEIARKALRWRPLVPDFELLHERVDALRSGTGLSCRRRSCFPDFVKASDRCSRRCVTVHLACDAVDLDPRRGRKPRSVDPHASRDFHRQMDG